MNKTIMPTSEETLISFTKFLYVLRAELISLHNYLFIYLFILLILVGVELPLCKVVTLS